MHCPESNRFQISSPNDSKQAKTNIYMNLVTNLWELRFLFKNPIGFWLLENAKGSISTNKEDATICMDKEADRGRHGRAKQSPTRATPGVTDNFLLGNKDIDRQLWRIPSFKKF